MSDLETSPFSEPKSKRWVWIVPSALLHLVILVIWLMLPEPEPRQPGERKLTIKKEQAEELQEHIEEANLEELREKVSELQSIKAAMVRIREREMVAVSDFEKEMFQEAPQDIAELLLDLAGIYERVHETYEGIVSSLELYREWQPMIRKAADEDTIKGLRILPNLKDYWNSFEGMGDQFEVAFYETGATIKAIEVKLEWVEDASIAEKIDALEAPMEKTFDMHQEAWGAIPNSWKRERSFSILTENLEETIDTVRRFRQSEIDGKAEVAKQRKEFEANIAEAEAELARLDQQIETEKAAFEKIDRSEARKDWDAKRTEIRKLERERGSVTSRLRDNQKRLDRTQYKADRQLTSAAKQIDNRLEHATPEPPEPKLLLETMAQQQAMINRLEKLAQSLEVPQ